MNNKKKYLFDHPQNVKYILYFLYGSCLVLFGLDFVINRYVYHSWENLWGFYPVFGFISCVILALVVTGLRTVLTRPEDYYDSQVEENHSEKRRKDSRDN